MMKRILALLAASALSLAALAASIDSIKIDVNLSKDGTAHVSEWWNVSVSSGTEWYLVRTNLGNIRILDFSVSEDGRQFVNVGEWDEDWSLDEKARKCGILSRGDGGKELCWGLGSMGNHRFEVHYRMTNAVDALRDYDVFHIQLVSPGLSSDADNVEVNIAVDSLSLTEENVRFWGFGFDGESSLRNGSVHMESTGRFSDSNSVIALIRFDKGIFRTENIVDRDFQEVLDRAMEGSDFGEDEDSAPGWVLFALEILGIASLAGIGVASAKHRKKKILGCSPDEVEWFRDIPYGGDLAKTEYTLKSLGEMKGGNTMPAALILRMIYGGQLGLNRLGDGKVEITFSDNPSFENLPPEAEELFFMMKEASGEDRILQDREFSRWALRNRSWIAEWSDSYESRGRTVSYDEAAQKSAREALGLKKFLQDFTSMDVKSSIEVHLWQEYLVFAALFGIAEKVAKELKDIDTTVYENTVFVDYATMYNVMRMTRSMSRAITGVRNYQQTASRGFGGHTSFGGGGGFHGGGFGGGCR